MKTHVAAIILVLGSNIPAFASPNQEKSPQASYFTDPNVCSKGWYCYEPHAQEKIEDSPLKSGVHSSQVIFNGKIDWDAVWTVPPEELRELINQALSFAQQAPHDEERMLNYLKLQGVAMRRAKQFQESWSAAILKYPVLDTTVARSPTLAGTTAEIVAEREDRSQAIASMREDMGILYFYSPTCRYCQQQTGILASFIEKWGWEKIQAINILEAPQAMQHYGVQAVPDIWVVGNVGGETRQRRLKTGLTEHSDLERGLLQAWSIWNRGTAYERPEMAQHLESFEHFLNNRKMQGTD